MREPLSFNVGYIGSHVSSLSGTIRKCGIPQWKQLIRRPYNLTPYEVYGNSSGELSTEQIRFEKLVL